MTIDMPDPDKCPDNIAESILNYVEHGWQPGSFVTSVLCNDLTGAVGNADHNNLWKIPHIVAWCYQKLPHHLWGSLEKVTAHLCAVQKRTTENDNSNCNDS